ncbi:MAG: hypothetical protein PHV02_03125 [Rhodocyclaceae bacterium]|nr:hypothetical protein [Rhodocyclaceae bacterium]
MNDTSQLERTETMRLNLVVSKVSEPDVFHELVKLPLRNRARNLKYWAYLGFMVASGRIAVDDKTNKFDTPGKIADKRQTKKVKSGSLAVSQPAPSGVDEKEYDDRDSGIANIF